MVFKRLTHQAAIRCSCKRLIPCCRISMLLQVKMKASVWQHLPVAIELCQFWTVTCGVKLLCVVAFILRGQDYPVLTDLFKCPCLLSVFVTVCNEFLRRYRHLLTTYLSSSFSNMVSGWYLEIISLLLNWWACQILLCRRQNVPIFALCDNK